MGLRHCARRPALAGIAAVLAMSAGGSSAATTTYRGMCDASAAVGLPGDRFVVANDEDNVLRIYKRGVPDVQATVLLSDFLASTEEVDIEGAARIGDRIYWITSHGQNKNGKDRPSRLRLFATQISAQTACRC